MRCQLSVYCCAGLYHWRWTFNQWRCTLPLPSGRCSSSWRTQNAPFLSSKSATSAYPLCCSLPLSLHIPTPTATALRIPVEVISLECTKKADCPHIRKGVRTSAKHTIHFLSAELLKCLQHASSSSCHVKSLGSEALPQHKHKSQR